MANTVKGYDFLVHTHEYHIPEAKIFRIPNAYYYPCFWVTAALYALKHKIPHKQLDIDPQIEGYASVIGFPQALGCTNQVNRINNGCGYSSMERLEDDHSADAGKTRISSCIREMFNIRNLPTTDPITIAIQELIDVIGELHDNVVSHSNGIGFSIAQSHSYHNYVKGNYLSFAIADNGIGFLSELKAQGIKEVETDKDAIAWCIIKNNTSKRKAVDDPWAQRVPDDALSNPFGKHIITKNKDNNHQGLGLDKLCQFVHKYKGELRIHSGRAALVVDNTGNLRYSENEREWVGVSISVLLNVNEFNDQIIEEIPEDIVNLMDKLRR